MGQKLAKAKSFTLAGYLSCDVRPHAEKLISDWEAEKDEHKLPSSRLSILKVEDRKKLKSFDADNAVLMM